VCSSDLSSTSSNTVGNIKTTTTTTTTKTFPQLPEAYWDALVNNLYADFEKVLMDNYNIELIPIEDVIKAKSYAALEPIKDEVSVVEIEKSYGGTKNLIPTTLSAIVDGISTTFAADRLDSRLIRELGVDGLIAVTLDIEMSWEGYRLSPRMSLRISGGPNGYKVGPTIYAQGLISGPGLELEEANMNSTYLSEVLPNIIRQDELMNALNVALNKLKEAEKEKDYETIWNLK